MSPGCLRLEASLDKEKYYHGESIAVNVLVDNNSNKTVKKIKLSENHSPSSRARQQKEGLGIIVQYRVKLRLVLGFGASDVSLELPFTLTHPKPVPESDDQELRVQDFDDTPTFSPGSSPALGPPLHDVTFSKPLPTAHVPTNDLIALNVDVSPSQPPIPPARMGQPAMHRPSGPPTPPSLWNPCRTLCRR
ncbi:unnamed protein product [Dicrocoelium dendriticum]|nr:unnamed protein product [Dicrocoelium dendriticum]